MTLNVTILTPTRIYQSSDFRLSRNNVPAGDSTMKLVTLQYPSFDGFISYTGHATIDAADTVDTAERVTRWLEGSAGFEFYRIVQVVREKSNEYVNAAVRRMGKRPRLSLIAAAFVRHTPVLALISNFQDAEKFFPEIRPEMTVSWKRPRPGEFPVVILTGSIAAITSSERLALGEAVRDAGEDSASVRNEIRLFNRGQHRKRPYGGISEECAVVSLDSGGAGFQDISGGSGLQVRSVLNGSPLDLNTLLESIGVNPTNTRIKGGAFIRGKSATRRVQQCTPSVIDFDNSDYEIVQIQHSPEAVCRPHAINDLGTVVGSIGDPADPAMSRYWTWTVSGGMKMIEGWQSRGYMACVNNGGDIALRVTDGEADTVVRLSGGHVDRFDVPDDMGNPEPISMNSAGIVCGSIETNRDMYDSNRTRPAYWDASGRLYVLEDLRGGRSGRAVSINNMGQILVWAHVGAFGRFALVWDSRSGDVQRMPYEVIPLYINASGEAVGIAQGDDGQQAPVVSYGLNDWARTQQPWGFAPCVANNSLQISGTVLMEYRVPWLATPNKPPTLLPTFKNHHCSIRGLNEAGELVGQLSADYDYHVVFWRPRSPDDMTSGSRQRR